jgi:hypothetical protein
MQALEHIVANYIKIFNFYKVKNFDVVGYNMLSPAYLSLVRQLKFNGLFIDNLIILQKIPHNGIARLKSLGIAEKRINVGNSTYLSKLLKAKIGYSLKNKNDIYLLYIITNVAEIPKHIVGSLYKYKAKL